MRDAPSEINRLVRTKDPAEVRRMFSRIAPTYDLLNRLLSAGIDRRWRRFAAKRLLKPETRRILDVCGGTGDFAMAIAREAKSRGLSPLITVSDFSRAMLKTGRSKWPGMRSGVWEENGAAAITTVPELTGTVADAIRLPYPTGSFDLVTVAFGIRNVADRDRALKEMARVCRPGGAVAVLEFSRMRALGLQRAFDWYMRNVMPLVGRVISGTQAYRYLAESVEAFPDSDEFLAELSIATGSSATARRLSFGIATLYVAQVKHGL